MSHACPHCGVRIEEDLVRCPLCGARMPGPLLPEWVRWIAPLLVALWAAYVFGR